MKQLPCQERIDREIERVFLRTLQFKGNPHVKLVSSISPKK